MRTISEPKAMRVGDRTAMLLAIVVGMACLVPLLLTPVLPVIDYYSHILRYYVLAHSGAGTPFAANYLPAWALLPNLGLDILGTAILWVVPPLLAAKLIVAMIILTLFAGVLYLGHALQGRVTLLTISLAGILVYSHILVWGFSNFLLGLGLAIGGVGFWIANEGRPRRQFGISAVLGILLLFVHAFAFAAWGLILAGVEVMQAVESREFRLRPVAIRLGRLLCLAVVPALLFLQMPTSEAEEGVTQVVANLSGYAEQGKLFGRIGVEIGRRLDSFLRVAEGFSPPLDWALGLLLWGTIAVGLFTGALRLDRRLWLAAPLMLILVVALPPSLFGVGHVDDRVPLILLCLLAAGLSAQPAARLAAPVTGILIGLFVVRILLVGWGYHQAGTVYQDYLDQIAKVDTGALGAPMLFDRDLGRDRFRPKCEPLSPLLALQNGTAVSTFANPTQQPLALSGPLQAARDKLRQQEATVNPADDRTTLYQQVLTRYFDAGFDTVVACDVEPSVPAPPGAEIKARGPQWTLYVKERDAPG